MRDPQTKEKKKAVQKPSGYNALVPAVEQASRILLTLSRGSSFRMNLTDICRSVGIHKSKGYSILNTLQKHGFIQRDPEKKTYSLGPGLIPLSRKVLDNLNYSEFVGPALEEITRATQSTAFFGLIADGSLFVVAKRESETKIGVTIGVGHQFPSTWGAHGKAIVAFMNDESRKKLLAGTKLYFHGEPKVLDRVQLDKELALCRKTGYAVDLGRMSRGIHAIASPVFGAGSNPIGAVFVIGTFPENLIPAYGPVVTEKAIEISRLFGAETNAVFDVSGIQGGRHG